MDDVHPAIDDSQVAKRLCGDIGIATSCWGESACETEQMLPFDQLITVDGCDLISRGGEKVAEATTRRKGAVARSVVESRLICWILRSLTGDGCRT